jgi:hypothetical protein
MLGRWSELVAGMQAVSDPLHVRTEQCNRSVSGEYLCVILGFVSKNHFVVIVLIFRNIVVPTTLPGRPLGR